MSNPDQPLQPANFSPQAPTSNGVEQQVRRPRWLVPAFGLLAVAALGVFVVLPLLMSSPAPSVSSIETADKSNSQQTNAAREPLLQDMPSKATQPLAERAPFAEAQSQRERRAAQEALQKVLELQDVLNVLSVNDWAADEYANAIARAVSGDTAYRERRFGEASLAYLDAAEQLVAIESSVPARVIDAIDSLTTAIEAGDHNQATSTLMTLQKLAINNPSLTPLQRRVEAIPGVTAALAAAAAAAEQRDFEQALTDAQSALTADPNSERATKARNRYRGLLEDQRYREAMSSGYLALERGEFDNAQTAFQRAASLQAGSTEAQTALSELASARVDARLRQLREQGAVKESAEDWQGAEAVYQEALAIDPTLVFAQQGLSRAQPRKQLDEQIKQVLAEPERLVDNNALNSAQTVLQKAQAISNRGAVLGNQVASLEQALRYAQTPVTIVLVSDGLTDVTLLRVKRLGTFPESALTLRPGRYTALGIRNGYQDVRIDFDVKPGEQQRIEVRCTQSIEGSL